MGYFITIEKTVTLEVLNQDTDKRESFQFTNKSKAEYAKHLLIESTGYSYPVQEKFQKVLHKPGVKEEIERLIQHLL